MKDAPTHLDLFSGIGGFTLAAGWAGFQTIGFSEIDPYCQAVLRKHWPEVPQFGDIRHIPRIECNLITGGFPCQPFSGAGRKLGKTDDRNLWPTMCDVIRRCRPYWVLAENVINIKNMVLAECLNDLAGIGYRGIPFDIPACAADLPTMERHIWIVASRDGNELESDTASIISRPTIAPERQPHCAGHAKLRGLPCLPASRLLRSRKGFPAYVDRIRAIGNAIVPQVAFEILKAIRQMMQ